ncbi:hypothetical protein QCA50_017347 [Cerrena zonata]|uniref:Uncharacterized protein n=1 Tax=Cerrena zonata TaxID=2478898 RepID=A0AAW0FDK7_9APHY
MATRSNDTGLLKKHVLSYIKKDGGALIPELKGAARNDKSERGWKHPDFAYLLMPVKYDPTPEILTFLRANDRRYPVTHNQLPRFLFPEGHVLVPMHEEDHLLEGHFIIFVLKHTYTTPSSVFSTGKGSRKGSNAERIGINALSACPTAYGCIQARHMLNTQPEWERIDGNFNAEKFYWSIVTILEDGDEGKAHLDKISKVVFGNNTQPPLSDDSEEESVEARILRHRRERAEAVTGGVPST